MIATARRAGGAHRLKRAQSGDAEKHSNVAINSAEAVEIRNAIEKLLPMLTDREKQVLYHLALGKSAAETSQEMFISADRVREIRQQIVKKFLKISEETPGGRAATS